MVIKTKRIKVKVILFLILAIFVCVSFRQMPVDSPGYYHSTPFKFNLQQSASTSAGVFTANGVLVRTLWSGIKYEAGTHHAVWDGTNNDGNLMPAAPYQIKVLSNNVKYTWEGVLGNTSGRFTGPTIFRGHNAIQGIAIAGNTAYYTVGYNEQGSSCQKFNTQYPQGKTTLGSGGIESNAVATDGKLVYWVSYEIKTNSNFIQATSVVNDTPVSFAEGQDLTVFKSKARLNVLEKALMPDRIKALAVQNTGQYLLSAHSNLNQVHVINKITGKFISSINITNPSAIAVDKKNHVWILGINNGKPAVLGYQIGNDGTLQYVNKVLPDLVKPLAIAVSPDDATVLVADGGESQQLKSYSTQSGKLIWTLGDLGGYSQNATVSNTKFYFSDMRSEPGTCLAFEPDGSFWVEDTGNARLQHYSASRIFMNRVMYLPTSYSVTVDRTDAARVFSDYLEFKIDYAKTLGPHNGSWTLVKNWGAMVPKEWDRKYTRLKDIITLKNRHTYALIGGEGKIVRQVIELTAQSALRFTGKMVAMNYSMDNDGNLYRISNFKHGTPNTWYKQTLNGFDQANNPLWGNDAAVASTQPATNNDPLNEGNGTVLYTGEKTSTDVFVAFNPRASVVNNTKPHLGGVRMGDNKWLWQTAAGTHRGYRGDFPPDGSFDNGNGVRYAGGAALALGRSIFWGYYGEFWKGSETNKWNQVHDDGLFIGQFGITGPQMSEKEGAALMAGNAMAASVVKGANGNLYLYHNDEATHSGVHRWKISNISSIAGQVIKVFLNYKKQGLLTECFNGTQLNNLNLFYTGLNASASFNTRQVPASALILNKNQETSVRLTGFIQPVNTASYTFATGSLANIRLWISGKLVLDNWAGKTNTQTSTPVPLNNDVAYPVKIEYKQAVGSTSFSLLWSVSGKMPTIIPTACLWPAEQPSQTTNIDLLAGLPFDGIVENNIYGWERGTSAEDYTNKYSQFWTVRTNKRVYDKRSSPDLHATFRQANTVKTITRNLGNALLPLKQWKISAVVNFEDNYANGDKDLSEKGGGGSYIEVLDKYGRIITRLFFHADNATDAGRMYANNQVVFKTTRNGISNIMHTTQPLTIGAENGICTFQYGSYPVVKTPVFDPASHWEKPETFRIYFWCKTQNSNRAIDIEKMSYSFK
ncbi:PA14 domain-containing protein [Mucilaginibacter terrae]|uniref:PA14 domain-containing protein n=1 Tax=Mucilaginibacter terrae TaxID=1955052 RepID=UPI0036393956